jgi:molybdopterin-guanine dinucleotide biosynthesis protein A
VSGRVLGAVLAGGASSRFGSDKALAMVDGRPLLAHACAALARVSDAVVVVGRGDVPDRPVPGLGPLGGIAGALAHAREQGFGSVLTIGCDMIAVPAALLADMLGHLPSYCADAPVLGHWPVALAPALLDRLSPDATSSPPRAGGEGPGPTGAKNTALSVRRWAASIGAVAIPSPVPLANINTPADLPA